MSVSVPEFWRLAQQSRILSQDQCADLTHRWQGMKGAVRTSSARTLAEWLVNEDALTRYQARLLLGGQPGPFYFGDYLITKKHRSGPLIDCFDAVHAPTQFPVTLRFVRGAALESTAGIDEARRLMETAPRAEGLPAQSALIPLYEWVDCGAYQFGVFGRVAGEPVEAVLASQGVFRPAAACRLVGHAAAALVPLHESGRAHGAIRPSAIWVAEDKDKNAEGKVTWLLPKELYEPWDALQNPKAWLNNTENRAAITVAEHMAPEAAGRAASPTSAADVYALGCVLYALLAGRPPFAGPTVAEVLQQHATEPLPIVARRDVSGPLYRLLAKMLAKEPAQRFADARQVAEAIRPFAEAGSDRSPPVRAPAEEGLGELHVSTEHRDAYLASLARRRGEVVDGELSGRSPTADESIPYAVPITDVPPQRTAVAMAAPLPSPSAIEPPPRLAGALAASPLTAATGRPRWHDWRIVLVAVLAASLAAAAAGVWHAATRGDGASASGIEAEGNSHKSQHPSGSEASTSPPNNGEQLIPDDGQTLWASPTRGVPISAAYLPLGTQGILAIRLADLLSHPEGESVTAALGPHVGKLLAALPETTSFDPDEIAQLVVGLRAGEPPGWSNTTLVLRLAAAISHERLEERLHDSRPVEVDGQTVLRRGDLAYFMPSAENGHVVVVADVDAAPAIVQQGGRPPPLRRGLELLLADADADRHVNLLFSPRLPLGDGRDLLALHAAALREPLVWMLGEKTPAALLSMHWSEDFFLELQVASTADPAPVEARSYLEARLRELPDRLEGHVVALQLAPYGRRLVVRLPEMVRRVVAYTRLQTQADRVVARCYLPITAGHNLLMAVEILLAETADNGTGAASITTASSPLSVRERLARPTSLSFGRETLETALALLSADIGVPIEIIGSDLQVEGITKNQSLAADLTDQPAQEILAEILRLANPDKSATGLSDPRQKLVYTLRAAEAGHEIVFITTRQAAQARGEELPDMFVYNGAHTQ